MTGPGPIGTGDRVRVLLDQEFWRNSGWFEGTVVRIEPYTAHRSFYWVELDSEIEEMHGGKTKLVSVMNPKHIQRTPDE